MSSSTATSTIPQPSSESQPLYTIDTQHDDMIHDAQLDYYGCKLATCSSGMSFLKQTTKKFKCFFLHLMLKFLSHI